MKSSINNENGVIQSVIHCDGELANFNCFVNKQIKKKEKNMFELENGKGCW